jgi:DNA-binding CsgD family transcriptional regulator
MRGDALTDFEALDHSPTREEAGYIGQNIPGNAWRAAGSMSASLLLSIVTLTCCRMGAGDIAPTSGGGSMAAAGSAVATIDGTLAVLAMTAVTVTGLVAICIRSRTVSLTLIFRVSLPELGAAALVRAFFPWAGALALSLAGMAICLLEYGSYLMAIGWQRAGTLDEGCALARPRILSYFVVALGFALAGKFVALLGVMGSMLVMVTALMVTFVLCVPSYEPRLVGLAALKGRGEDARSLDASGLGSYEGYIARAGLTAREAEVMVLLLAGYDAPGIAERLCVSRATVNTHVHHIYEKFGVHSKAELAMAVGKTPEVSI